ncbi:HAD family hydrolase [Streptomyces iconiensis]|uniref:HAD family hydrolase n=1 Tax=Streptomyces iconiensis TaxID=1384038 RepID=A0ABT6ZV91_9ACTN|nr:HAD family hydrolase [Streptomyces iconiensis]MDJ1132995.1 HAD family hydrolase [Streptomyces iconiensis]
MTVSCAAVLFDLDGTLIDHDAASDAAVVAALPQQRRLSHVGAEEIIRWWRELEASAMDRYLAGEITFQEQRRLRVTGLADRCGLGRWSDDMADTWFARYLERYEAEWRAFPDVLPALASLRRTSAGLLFGVVTNGDAAQQRRKLARVGLAGRLPYVIASSEVGAAKPDPAIFRAACSALRLPAAQVVYVGDRLGTDAEAAAGAGLHGVWLDRQAARPGPLSVPRVESLAELPSLVTSPPSAPGRHPRA